MIIMTKCTEDEVILNVEGRIDTYTADEFENKLLEAVEMADTIKIDFTHVEFVSSAGLRALLNGQKQVDEEEKEMCVVNINEIVEDIFVSTGFMNVLNIE